MFTQEISLLKDLKQKHPWSGSYMVKKAKFKYLLNGLCEIHGVDAPRLLIPKDKEQYEWTKKVYGDCWCQLGKIRVRNFSVITLLHEFRHWLDYNTAGLKRKKASEWRANYYSTYRFYYVWPERIKLLNELFTEKELSLKPENYKTDAYIQAMEDLVRGDLRL